MNIVIIGAGGMGRHVASILSSERLNVILVDPDPKQLEVAGWTIDVATHQGSGTDWELMEDLLDLSPDALVALTDSDETNLVACALAKHLGYPKTIARIGDYRYLNQTRLDFGQIFTVDHFVGPELLSAHEILKYVASSGSLMVHNFAQGAVQMRTLAIPKKWKQSDVMLMNLNLPKEVIVGLIYRDKDSTGEKEILFPHGRDVILAGDEVTFIGETEAIADLHRFFGIKQRHARSAVLVGGSTVGFNLARLLTLREVEVKLIEKDRERCMFLAEKLPDCTIIHHDGTDADFLRSEKIDDTDLFVACTSTDEVNLVSALLAKELGCEDVIAVMSNQSYHPVAAHFGINHVVSPRITAADQVLSQILSGTVTSLISFYENEAEVMEIRISSHSKVVGIPLTELGPLLPRDFLIAMIQNRGRIMVANGEKIISPGDTVVVITHPRHIADIKKIF